MATETKPEQKSQGGKWLMIAGIVILFGVLAYGIFASPSDTVTTPNYQTSCTEAGGTWIAEHSECEYIDPETCVSLGGQFNECGSACRHEEELVACTMQCVPFCAL